jgi:SAM-dependent methyltransferase
VTDRPPRTKPSRLRSERPRSPPNPASATERTPRERFLDTDSYRARREWLRYEGTAQRDLFRQLRVRFLQRHAVDGGWVLDAGAGPRRFTRFLGKGGSRRVAVDLSRTMLLAHPERRTPPNSDLGGPTSLVQGDCRRPPFLGGAFQEVVLLGNTLGFAGAHGEELLSACEDLLATDGTLVVEVAPGPGERSRYLARLPPKSVGRLFEAPPSALLARIDREGFVRAPARHESRSFQRWDPEMLRRRWANLRWTSVDILAVAPGLGLDGERAAAVRASPRAWKNLLEVEEFIGRREERWPNAAAVLVAARRTPVQAEG